MALCLGQTGRVVLGCLAMVVIRMIYQYLRVVELVIAFLILAQLAAYLIPRSTLTKSERRSAIFNEAAITSSFESYRPGPNRSSRRQDEIQMHLRRLDIAAVATASSSSDGDHIGPDSRSIRVPQSPGEAIRRHPSYDGNHTGLVTRPNGAPRKQREEIQRHLQRLAMAAASADAGVEYVSPSLLYQGEGVNIE